MSRTTNPVLTEQIVRAARRLWHQRGEKGLTLRAVARAAGTTTPSVYQRFPAKKDLIAAIADQIRLEIGETVAGSSSFEQAFKRYLQFAKRERQEYLMMASSAFGEMFQPGGRRPGLEWGQGMLVRRHGGKPEDYTGTLYAMVSLLHGTANFVLNMPPGALADHIEESCLQTILLLAKRPLETARRHKKRR